MTGEAGSLPAETPGRGWTSVLRERGGPVPGPRSHTGCPRRCRAHAAARAAPRQATVLPGRSWAAHSHALTGTQRQGRVCTNTKPVLKSPLWKPCLQMGFGCIPGNQLHFRKKIELKHKETVRVRASPGQKRAGVLHHLTCMEQRHACFHVLRREAVHFAGRTHPTESSRAATHSSSASGHRLCGPETAVQPENAGSKVLMFSKSTFLHLVTKQQNLKSISRFVRLLFQPPRPQNTALGDSYVSLLIAKTCL